MYQELNAIVLPNSSIQMEWSDTEPTELLKGGIKVALPAAGCLPPDSLKSQTYFATTTTPDSVTTHPLNLSSSWS